LLVGGPCGERERERESEKERERERKRAREREKESERERERKRARERKKESARERGRERERERKRARERASACCGLYRALASRRSKKPQKEAAAAPPRATAPPSQLPPVTGLRPDTTATARPLVEHMSASQYTASFGRAGGREAACGVANKRLLDQIRDRARKPGDGGLVVKFRIQVQKVGRQQSVFV
jgi:hypothetical protein